MKLYNEDGDEVEAFTQKEVDAKISETTKQAEEAKTALEAKTKEYDTLSKRYEDKNTSYSELLKKNKEYEEGEKTRSEETTSAYEKAIADKVKEIAGDDKEYAKELKKQLELLAESGELRENQHRFQPTGLALKMLEESEEADRKRPSSVRNYSQ